MCYSEGRGVPLDKEQAVGWHHHSHHNIITVVLQISSYNDIVVQYVLPPRRVLLWRRG